MRLVGTQELVVIAVLIAYIAFTPGLPAVRQLFSTGVGKAVGLVVFVAVWKYVSHPVALLLLVNYIRCSGMREGFEGDEASPPAAGSELPANSYCPTDTFFDMGMCKNSTTGQSVPAVKCQEGEMWDGAKCNPASVSAQAEAAKMPGTESALNLPTAGGVQPDTKEAYLNYAPV